VTVPSYPSIARLRFDPYQSDHQGSLSGKGSQEDLRLVHQGPQTMAPWVSTGEGTMDDSAKGSSLSSRKGFNFPQEQHLHGGRVSSAPSSDGFSSMAQRPSERIQPLLSPLSNTSNGLNSPSGSGGPGAITV
jgi:hypothetical protein